MPSAVNTPRATSRCSIAYVIRLWPRAPYEALMLAAVPLSYSAIYVLVQTEPRYTYPLLWLHMLLCAQLISRSRLLAGAGEASDSNVGALG